MSARQQFDTALSAAVVNGVCQSQTPGGAGNLTMNGSLVATGVATLDATSGQVNARQVLFTNVGNETGHNFTITGTVLAGGASVTEVVAGAGAGTFTSTNYFITVTNIAIDAAAAGAIQVGTNGVGASQWRAVDRKTSPFNLTLAAILKSGSANWTMESTDNDVFDRTVIPTPTADATHAAKAATFRSASTTVCMAMRTKINSGTGTVTTIIEQSDRIS